MAKTQIKAGMVLDTLTREELAHTIDDHTRNWFQEKARGVAPVRFDGAAAVAGSTVALPSSNDGPWGPKAGFCWKVERITAAGLAGSDVLSVYRNVVTDRTFLGVCTVASPSMSDTGKGLILQGEETLVFSGSSLTATGYVTVNGEGIEVASSDYYKLT